MSAATKYVMCRERPQQNIGTEDGFVVRKLWHPTGRPTDQTTDGTTDS